MISRRFLSLSLVLAVGAAGMPTLAHAAAAPTPLRASIDRALATPDVPLAPAAPARRDQTSGSTMGGGGGGGAMLLTLLTTAVSIGAAVYLVKQMKKNDDPTPSPSLR